MRALVGDAVQNRHCAIGQLADELKAAGRAPDGWWPEAGVAIEVDSRQWHMAPDDWERTMARHSNLGQYGIVTLHVTPHQLRTDPAGFLRKAANAYKAGVTRPRLNILTLTAVA